ncbi:MAG: hypothetical protein IPG07_13315 [Crocinitomicaceae bacterium]|nr:hypothetical protein [Crocinitomicaceae bacterium]
MSIQPEIFLYFFNEIMDYYADRNTEIIKQLQKKLGVLKINVVVAGHSEGATIAAN